MASIAVIGGGVAGLATALACARTGHVVTLFERDVVHPPEDPRDAFGWERHGIPHFLQPHAFLARGIRELRRNAPDIYDALLEAGAHELRLDLKMPPGDEIPEDDDLRFLGVRRPVLEAVLRRKVANEPNVEVRAGTTVRGLLWDEAATDVPVARGVATDDGPEAAELVVDASGRSSVVPHWIVDAGGEAPLEESSDCGLVYYSRYFRFLPGKAHRDGPWLLGPRVELGFYELGTFWGDSDTFSMVQQIHSDDRSLRGLRRPDAYMRALRSVPAAAPFVAEDVSEPITEVIPMGQLRNTWRSFLREGRPIAKGVVALGDALCHTNPRYAWGLSLSLAHAFRLARLLGSSESQEVATLAFYEETAPEVRSAFDVARETDEARKRYWSGEPTDIYSPEGCLPLFLLQAFPMAGTQDRDVFRAAIKRLMFLEEPRLIENNDELLRRGAEIIRRMRGSGPPPRQGPDRSEMEGLVSASD